MKTHTTEFKENISLFGKEIDSKITYELNGETIELGTEDLNSVTPHYEGAILKSVMKQLDIDSNVEIPLGTILNYQFGLKVRSGKNKLQPNNLQTQTKNGITASYDADTQTYTFNGTCTADNTSFIIARNTINFVANKTTSSTHWIDGNVTGYCKMRHYDSDFIQQNIYNLNTLSSENPVAFKKCTANFTSPVDKQSIRFDRGTIANNFKIRIMVTDDFDIIYETWGTNNYEYINFGNYVVYSIEKQEDTNSYKITCYDKMLYSMIPYEDMNITYPITIRNYINTICTHLGLTFKNANGTFANYDKTITSELYLDENGGDLGYTFRDVLDELSQVTASTICINEDDDELEIRYINNTNDTIDEEYLKDINVNFGENFGPVNTIVLSRSAGADNIYYPSVLPENPYELKISDNQIMNGNDRADYMPDIYNKLNGLEYYINDFSSPGIAYYNLCDRYNVKIGENTYSCVMFNDELNVTQGLEENIYTDLPEETETDYTKADKTDRKINQTILSVDKQNQKIEAKVSKDDIIADLNIAIVDGQGVINATGNKFILDADNASIDEYGNAEFNNATLRGGDLILEDNGGESSSIQIHALNSQDSKVIMEQDLSNVTMTIKEPKNFTISSLPAQDTLLTTDGGFEIAIQPIVDDDYNYSIYTTNPSQELAKLKIESYDFDYELYHVEDYSTINVLQTNANTGSVDFINSENSFSNLIRIVGTESIDKISKYSSSGIDLDIYNSYATNNGYIPTQEEIDEVAIRIAQGDTFTQEEIEKYDCNNDGVITPVDLLALKKIILTGATMTQPAHFSINTETSNQALGVEEIMSLKDGNGNTRFALGMNGIYFNDGNLLDELYFKENEEFELDAFMPCPGFLTSGNKELIFNVVMPKSLKNINSIAISGNLYIDIRKPSGGYIAGNVDFNTSSYTINITKITNNTLRLSITSSTNFDSVNNQPLAGDIHSGTTFVFS